MIAFIKKFLDRKKQDQLVIERQRDELAALDWLKTQRCSVNFAGGYKDFTNVWIMVHEKADSAAILSQGSNSDFLEAVNEAKCKLEAR